MSNEFSPKDQRGFANLITDNNHNLGKGQSAFYLPWCRIENGYECYRANEVSCGAASGHDGVRADQGVLGLLVDQADGHVQLLGHGLHHLGVDALKSEQLD